MAYFKVSKGVVVSVSHPKPDDLMGWKKANGEVYAGQLWDGKTLTNPPVPAASTDPRDYPLTRTQFLIFMANGYDDALAIIMPTLKTVDVSLWAKTKNDAETAPQFHFAGIQGLLANPAFAGLIPKGLDVTEATLSKQWMLAKNY